MANEQKDRPSIQSRSVRRRIAAQKGEPSPDFSPDRPFNQVQGKLRGNIHEIASLLARRIVAEASKNNIDGAVIVRFNAEADKEIIALIAEAKKENTEQVDAMLVEAKRVGKREERERTEVYKQALIADASDLWNVTNAIKKEIESREWILEGRGCYEWDDNRYKDETRLAFEAVLELIKNVQHPAQQRFSQALKGEK